jgi:sec-independent protein translocase protein TatB
MFNLGMGEITVILVLALLFVGPSKLPELAAGLGKFIRQIRKTTADVKNEIVLDDSFRKPFEELRDAVTLSPEELKRRDQIKVALENARRQAEEFERANAAPQVEANPDAPKPDEGAATPPPEPIAAGSATNGEVVPPPFPPPPPLVPVPPVAPPVGTFPRAPTPVPLPPGRLGASQRVTPPVSSVASDRANITQVLAEEDLLPAAAASKKAGPPPLPPPLPGVAPPPLPGTKKG